MYKTCVFLLKNHIYECSLCFTYVGFEVALLGPSPLSITRDAKVWPLSTMETKKRKLPPIQVLPCHLKSFIIWLININVVL
jgi:hypothetical protein